LITYIEPDVCMDAPENNINCCQLPLEEGHYHIFFVSQQCGLTKC